MNDADQIGDHAAQDSPADIVLGRNPASLKPKGACWYCNQPLDNIRRFCSKACADDYRTEEETFSGGS